MLFANHASVSTPTRVGYTCTDNEGGVHLNTVELDFKRCYTTIMENMNISPESCIRYVEGDYCWNSKFSHTEDDDERFFDVFLGNS